MAILRGCILPLDVRSRLAAGKHKNYIDFAANVIPEKYYEKVFAENTRRIYGLDFA